MLTSNVPLNIQNERVYREVTLKTDIPAEDMLIQFERQQPSLHCTQLCCGMANRICVSLKDLLTIKKISLFQKEGRKL